VASLSVILFLSLAVSLSLAIPGHPTQSRSKVSGSEDKPTASPPGLGRKWNSSALFVILSGNRFATTINLPMIFSIFVYNKYIENRKGKLKTITLSA
jgi:hypothetical protein